jgi:hypothetical protein
MRNIRGQIIGAIKAAINISAALLVIAQATGPQALVKHESKKVSEDGKRQVWLDRENKGSSFRLATNDHITFAPAKVAAISNRSAPAKICPSTTINASAVSKMVKTGFRPVHSNRTFLSD